MRTFALLGYDGCEASSLTATADLLHLLNTLWQRQNGAGTLFNWRILSPSGADLSTSAGIRLGVEGDWSAARGADVVVLPAMYYLRTRDFLARVGGMRGQLAVLAQWREEGSRVAASCTGTFLLAESGLLDGRRATTSWWLRQVFSERYPRVLLEPDALVTEQDGIYCGGPHTARASLLLQLVEPFVGRDLTLLAAKLLLVDTNRSSQAPYVSLQAYLGHNDALVGRAQQWMQARLAEDLSLEGLAEQLGTSVRTLIRRFKAATGMTPASYLQSLRVDAAKRLLEGTGMSFERVIEQVGYRDASAFRKLFARTTGLTPREYRLRFAPAERLG